MAVWGCALLALHICVLQTSISKQVSALFEELATIYTTVCTSVHSRCRQGQEHEQFRMLQHSMEWPLQIDKPTKFSWD